MPSKVASTCRYIQMKGYKHTWKVTYIHERLYMRYMKGTYHLNGYIYTWKVVHERYVPLEWLHIYMKGCTLKVHDVHKIYILERLHALMKGTWKVVHEVVERYILERFHTYMKGWLHIIGCTWGTWKVHTWRLHKRLSKSYCYVIKADPLITLNASQYYHFCLISCTRVRIRCR